MTLKNPAVTVSVYHYLHYMSHYSLWLTPALNTSLSTPASDHHYHSCLSLSVYLNSFFVCCSLSSLVCFVVSALIYCNLVDH